MEDASRRATSSSKLIPDVMPLCVIEGLEVIQIHQHEGAISIVPCTTGQRLPQAIQHQSAVGKFRQRVVIGQLLERFSGRLALGDVDESDHRTNDLAVLHLRVGPTFDRKRAAVTAPIDVGIGVARADFSHRPIRPALLNGDGAAVHPAVMNRCMHGLADQLGVAGITQNPQASRIGKSKAAIRVDTEYSLTCRFEHQAQARFFGAKPL